MSGGNRTAGAACEFLVVGAGSAGCVTARVLAAAGCDVCLVEAGPPAPPRRRPAEYLSTFGTSEDWNLRTVAQPQLAGRSLAWPRGRGPGGSTRINAMIWFPPREGDLQSLHRAGGEDWNPEMLHSSLDEVTCWVRPEKPRGLSRAAESFLKVSHPAIVPPHPYLRMTDAAGRRTADDLLTGLGDRLRRVTARVDRILFDGDTAVGVSCDAGDEAIFARRGVILCGGAIHSPAILMRSGIGPREALRDAGIDVRIESDAVGANLADHLIMPVAFSLPDRERFPAAFSTRDLARWQAVSTGPVASNLAEAGAVYRVETADGGGEVQVHITPTHYLLHPAPKSPPAMTIGVNACAPRSRGRLSIASGDPDEPPRIDPAYLSEAHDRSVLVEAVALARRIAEEISLARPADGELVPGSARQSEEAIGRAISRFAQTLYHPVGTCRMGSDPGSAVDPQLRVRGCGGLYVVDASVFPQIPSVNPNAAVTMLAHRAAGRIVTA